jgi:hypothetical protein
MRKILWLMMEGDEEGGRRGDKDVSFFVSVCVGKWDPVALPSSFLPPTHQPFLFLGSKGDRKGFR